MKQFLPKLVTQSILLCASVAAVGLPLSASASPIVGNFSIAGGNIFDSTQITFTNPAYVLSSTLPGLSGLLSSPSVAQPVTMTSFLYANAVGTQLFTTTQGATTVTFTITSDTATYMPSSLTQSASLWVYGYGTITDTGYDPTNAAFSLTTSSTGAISFQIVGDSPAVTPEPSSLLLLGTGMLAGGIILLRRYRGPRCFAS